MSYDPFSALFDLIDEGFNSRTGNGANDSRLRHRNFAPSVTRPRLDVHVDEKANAVTTTVELPGINKQDVNIDVHNNILTISGESRLSDNYDENGYVVRERRHGKFSRSLQLPQGVKAEDIKASMADGLLTLSFPKTTPDQAPKKISVA